jgi:16S rRNA G527 N7-methylase RsmG
MRDAQHELICKGLAALSIDEQRAAPLYEYLQLLQKWNKPFNLTAIKKAEEMIRNTSWTVFQYWRTSAVLAVFAT